MVMWSVVTQEPRNPTPRESGCDIADAQVLSKFAGIIAVEWFPDRPRRPLEIKILAREMRSVTIAIGESKFHVIRSTEVAYYRWRRFFAFWPDGLQRRQR